MSVATTPAVSVSDRRNPARQYQSIATGIATTLGFAIFGGDFLNRVMGISADNRTLILVLLAIYLFQRIR